MTLCDLSLNQLRRLYRRMYRSLPDGGHFGWDFATLWLLYPGKAAAMLAVHSEIIAREEKLVCTSK